MSTRLSYSCTIIAHFSRIGALFVLYSGGDAKTSGAEYSRIAKALLSGSFPPPTASISSFKVNLSPYCILDVNVRQIVGRDRWREGRTVRCEFEELESELFNKRKMSKSIR